MTIYGGPGIEGKKTVSMGESFKAGCVSGPSDPSVNFTWSVNGIRMPVSFNYLNLIKLTVVIIILMYFSHHMSVVVKLQRHQEIHMKCGLRF